MDHDGRKLAYVINQRAPFDWVVSYGDGQAIDSFETLAEAFAFVATLEKY